MFNSIPKTIVLWAKQNEWQMQADKSCTKKLNGSTVINCQSIDGIGSVMPNSY